MLWRYSQSATIDFSTHAVDQLKIRLNITRPMVRQTLIRPNKILGTFRERQLFRKRYGDKILEVVAVKEDNTIIVVTQYFLGQES